MRPERTGQAGLDFSAYLSQAMQSKEWAGANNLQRQGLADLNPKDLDRSQQEPDNAAPATSTAASALTRRQTADPSASRDEPRSSNANASGTHQELTQRALRNASLRAAQSRADGTAGGRATSGEARTRKAATRREEDAHSTSAPSTPWAVAANAPHHPVQETSDAPAQHAAASTAASTVATAPTVGTLTDTPTSNAVGTEPVLQGASLATPATDSLASAAAGLTTVQVSPHLHIITPGQGVVNEQSLQAFAQSMGIDAAQFKQLVSATPAGSVDASGLRAGVTATDALTGTPLLPAAPLDPSAIDVSQVVPAGLPLEDLHIDWMGGRKNSLEASSPSTLDVLGMRENGSGADAITALQESADAGAQEQPDHNPGMGTAQLAANARAAVSSSANAANAPAPQNMTEHFEKLSAKLATEMAGRIHEQFSQGEWKMKFALKPASLGQVDVQLEMRDGKLAAVLQADNPMTQDLLQNGSQRLRDALSQMGLSQSSVSVGDGRSQAFQGDRQSGGHGQGLASAHPTDSPDDSVQTVARTPRRDSLSQLDFYA